MADPGLNPSTSIPTSSATPNLQAVTTVGATTNQATTFTNTVTMKNSTPDITSMIADVTDSGGGFAKSASFRVNGVERCYYGTTFGFPGFANPISADYIFFAFADASNYLLLDGVADTISIVSTYFDVLGVMRPSSVIWNANGTAANPSYSFLNDTGMGFYRSAASSMGFSISGVQQSLWDASGYTLQSGVISAPSGSLTLPSYTFNGDTDTGIYSFSANTIGFTGQASALGSWNKTSLDIAQGGITNISGNATRPAYTFTSATGNGMFNVGASAIGLTVSSTERVRISTSGIQSSTGAVGSPSYAFISDTNTGFANISADTIQAVTGGAERTRWTTTEKLFSEGFNIQFGTTTGTKIGTGTTQKIGFWNKTPVVQPSAYTPTNVTTDRSYDANSTTLDEVADVLGTLIADLQSVGLIG